MEFTFNNINEAMDKISQANKIGFAAVLTENSDSITVYFTHKNYVKGEKR